MSLAIRGMFEEGGDVHTTSAERATYTCIVPNSYRLDNYNKRRSLN